MSHHYYPIFSIGFLRALVIHMRPYLLFVSGVAGLTGMAIVDGDAIPMTEFLMAFIPFFLGYGFGQALTDCFQVDTDAISSPYRPLVKKEISPKSLGFVSATSLILISISVIYLNYYNIIWGGLSILGLATYTYFKKNYWFTGPFYNAWIVMLLPVMGYMAISGCDLKALLNREMILVGTVTFFSYANFVLMGYLKDISADRQTNYKTFPVVFGWDKTVWVGDVFVLASILPAYLIIGYDDLVAGIVFIVASALAIAGQLFAHFTREKVESNAAFPIASTVRSFILWHLAIVLHFQPGWLVFSAFFYVFYELVLYFRPSKAQI